MTPPRVLSIAGSDPSGGAGVQADLKTFAALGCYGMAVLTALTAQDTTGVSGVHLPGAPFVAAQLAAVLADCPPVAVKTGMLPSADVVRTVAVALEPLADAPVVVDPVLVATSGDALAEPEVAAALRDVLAPLAAVVTPNAFEAEALTGVEVRTVEDAVRAGRCLLDTGARAALVKGGDLPGDRITDVLVARGAEPVVWTDARIPLGATHGTGCTLSSALAAFLALGHDVLPAAVEARAFVRRGLQTAFAVGRGAVPVNHLEAAEAPTR